MQNTEDIDKRIDRFLRKKMSPDEEIAFLQDIMSNSDLHERARYTALLAQEIINLGKETDRNIIIEIQVNL